MPGLQFTSLDKPNFSNSDSPRRRLLSEGLDGACKEIGGKGMTGFSRWQTDPIGFCETHFGDHFYSSIRQVAESVRDNPITLVRSANAVGKTHIAARLGLWFYLSFPVSRVFTCAAPPEDNLKLLLWGEIESVVMKHKAMFASHRLTNDLFLGDSSQHCIAGVTIPASGSPAQREARFSGKHAPYMLFIVDEGDAVPLEVYRGIDSCMSGGTVTRLLILFNPRHASGHLLNLEKEKGANVVHLSALDHPNVVSGENAIPGAVTQEVTVQRIHKWTRPLAPGEPRTPYCFEVPDFLVGAVAPREQGGGYFQPLEAGWRVIVRAAFSYMVLGQYPAAGSDQLISREDIDKAVARWNEHVAQFGERGFGEAIGGLDVAEYGDDGNVLALRYGKWLAPLRPLESGVNPLVTSRSALEIWHEIQPEQIFIDATGVGSSVPAYMFEQVKRSSEMLIHESFVGKKFNERPTYQSDQGEFLQLRDQLYWTFADWIRADGMLPPDQLLIDELQALTYEIRGSKIKVIEKKELRKILGRSPDRLDAAALTFAGETGPTEVPVPKYPTAERMAQLRAELQGRKQSWPRGPR